MRCGPLGKAACVSLAGIALLLEACGTRQLHPFDLDEARVGAPGVETVGLLPLNVLATLRPELDAGTGSVSEEIRSHLEACGRRVQPFGMGEARSIWTEVAGPDADAEISDARMAAYVKRLHALRPFDVLVVPNLVLRDARIRYSTQEAAWDGVSRRIEVAGYHHMSGDLAVTSKLRGEFVAASLSVRAFEPDGTRAFESYGGLDLIHEVEYRTEFAVDANMHRYPVPRARVRLKRERLGDEGRIREGVVMAFHPYLVSPERPVGGAP